MAPDACPTPTGVFGFDLHVQARDANGLPYSPIWEAQQKGPQFSGAYCRPDPERLCGGFPTDQPNGSPHGRPQCDSTAGVDAPTGFHALMCSLESFNDGRHDKLRGHVNWVPATYEGFLDWEDASARPPFGDGDLTLSLAPVERTANSFQLAARRAALTPYPLGGPVALHIEFKASEVSDHFEHTWWKEFRDGVNGKTNAALHSLPTTRFAVATGLLGMDAEHMGHTELHPVYALALQIGCNKVEADGRLSSRWAIWARNWGNEGYCSRYDCHHRLVLDPSGSMTLRLPLGAVTGVSDLEFGSSDEETQLWANSPAIGVAQKPDLDPSGAFALVRLKLPPPEKTPLVYGELTLRFRGTSEASAPACPADPRASTTGAALISARTGPAGPEGAEGLLAELAARVPPEDRTRLEGSFARRELLAPAQSFARVVPAGEIRPTGSAAVSDEFACAPPSALMAAAGDPEKDAVCAAVKRLPKQRLEADKRLRQLSRECSR